MRLSGFWCVVALGLYGCSSDGDGGSTTAATDCKTTAGVSAQIFQKKCGTSGCHSAADLPDLASAGVESRVVGVPASAPCTDKTLVVAGNPDASFLYHKLADSKPACGNRMPMGDTLTPAELACVREWIVALPGGSSDAGTDSTTSDTGGVETSSCTTGLTDCCGKCVDTKTDAANCGACGKACAAGQTCSASACSCGTAVSFSKDIQPIFTASCATATCHGGTLPKGSLNLTTGKSYAELVNVKATGVGCATRTLVVPSSVPTSYLMNKLTGVDICGSQMPKTGGLATASVDKIRSWICSGAKND